jgi:hypothetical protein
MRHVSTRLAAAVTGTLLTAAIPVTASAQVHSPAAHQRTAARFVAAGSASRTAGSNAVRPNYVGTGSHPKFNGLSLFQCPASTCNQGVANMTDDVAALCYLPGTTGWGGYGGPWTLVLNHNNEETGWVALNNLTPDVAGTPIYPC